MPLFAVILFILLAYNMCSPRVQVSEDGNPPRCNRASCYDYKTGHYVSADEWNKRRESEQ